MTVLDSPRTALPVCGVVRGGPTFIERVREWYELNHGPLPKRPLGSIISREVSFTHVLENLTPTINRLTRHGRAPGIGTHEWIDLPNGDARKVAAIYDAALMWALHVENLQLARVEASHAVRESTDWPVIAKQNRQRAEFERDNPWAKRVTT